MNGRIRRQKGGGSSLLDLDQSFRAGIGRLGQKARSILALQDRDVWAQGGDPDLLAHMVGGALILERLGVQKGKIIRIEDAGAHLAFMTCTAMALLIHALDAEMRLILLDTIKLLAMCCPVEITINDLPPFEALPDRYRQSPAIRQQYQDLENLPESRRDVTLADALALYRILEQANSNQFSETFYQVDEATEGLRTAGQRILEINGT